MIGLVAILAAASVGLWLPGGFPEHRLREAPRSARKPWRWSLVVLANLGVVVGFGLLGLAVAAVIQSVGVVAWWRLRDRRLMRAKRNRAEACNALAAQLATGCLPEAAVSLVAADYPDWRPLAEAAELRLDVSAQFQSLEMPELSAAWLLANDAGASLSGGAKRAARRVRRELDQTRQVASELSSARATGRLLATLPLVGVGLGYLMGGDPIRFLVGGLAGHCLLLAGAVLAGAGLLWTEWIAREGR